VPSFKTAIHCARLQQIHKNLYLSRPAASHRTTPLRAASGTAFFPLPNERAGTRRLDGQQ